MVLTKEEMNEKLLYVQEINIYYPAKWNTANQLQNELIDVIERYFEGVKNITRIANIQYGVRPVKRENGELIREEPMTEDEYTIWKHNVQYQIPPEHPEAKESN